jgi:tRNA threonylcarbamoyladenosine biosynthesis protein TsaE
MMEILVSTAHLKYTTRMLEAKKRTTISNSAGETINIAKDFARILRPGDVVYLYGELGSGKTIFVKGVCVGLGVKDDVTSPSFVIATEYKGAVRIAHIDLYRLETTDAGSLPLEEYVLEKGITLIEWADRIQVTDKGIRVKFTILDHEKRKIEIEDLRD